jgi:hypothetical protein
VGAYLFIWKLTCFGCNFFQADAWGCADSCGEASWDKSFLISPPFYFCGRHENVVRSYQIVIVGRIFIALTFGGCAVQNLIFRFLQSRQKVQIWLFEQNDLRIEGRIIVRPTSAMRYTRCAWLCNGASDGLTWGAS